MTDADAYGRFPSSTSWSLIDLARDPDSAHYHAALTLLLRRYLPALRAHLVKRRGIGADEVADLLQGFVAARLLGKGLLLSAERGRGRFRGLIVKALDRYVEDERRRGDARRRRPPGGRTLGLASLRQVAGSSPEPDRAFDVEWARGVLGEALSRFREHCLSSRLEAHWGAFEMRVLGPIFDGAPPADLPSIAAELGYASPAQAGNALVTAKRGFARCLRQVVREYASEEEVESEIRDLRKILSES